MSQPAHSLVTPCTLNHRPFPAARQPPISYAPSLLSAPMDGLSAAASVAGIASLAVQLAESITKLYVVTPESQLDE